MIAAPEKRLWLRLASECNNNCIFCLDGDRRGGGFLPLASALAALRAGRRQGYYRVVLSGGEASIHPDFIAIVSAAREAGYTHIQTITNGRRFFYKDFFDAALKAGLGEITFSIHSHKAAVHDALTSSPGSFVQAVSALRRALAAPLLVSQDIVLTRKNVRTLRETLDFFSGLGVREFDLMQLIPFGNAWQNRAALLYDPATELPALRRAFALSRREDLRLWTNRFPPQYLEGFENLIQHPAKLHDEVRGELGMFPAFLDEGKKPYCLGVRCKYCILKNLCSDILELRKNGNLPAYDNPPCLGGGKAAGSPFSIKNKTGVRALDSFVDFHSSHRYYLKTAACAKCGAAKKCRGANIFHIMEHGFASLHPVAAK